MLRIVYLSITRAEDRPRSFDKPTAASIQEAQLSQTNRAMLRVIGYFVNSFEVIPNDILEKGISP